MRFYSLDIFRGSAVLFMFFINYLTISSYGLPLLLQHFQKGIMLPGDMIMPLFQLILGVSLVIYADKKKNEGKSGNEIIFASWKRGVVLIAIGLVLDFFLFRLRMEWGVLQALGASLVVAAPLLVFEMRKRALAAFIMLFLYAIMFYVPELLQAIEKNAYGGPLGMFSLGAIAVLGTVAGEMAYLKKTKTMEIALFGLLIMLSGLMASFFIPFSQTNATASFSLFSAGLSIMLLAAFRQLEGKKNAALKPLEVFGKNAFAAWCFQYFVVFYPVIYLAGGKFLPWYLGIGFVAMAISLSYVILDMLDFFKIRLNI